MLQFGNSFPARGLGGPRSRAGSLAAATMPPRRVVRKPTPTGSPARGGFWSAEGLFFLLMLLVLTGLAFTAYRHSQERQREADQAASAQHAQK